MTRANVRPCHDCGGERPAGLQGKRGDKYLPLCASCKALNDAPPYLRRSYRNARGGS